MLTSHIAQGFQFQQWWYNQLPFHEGDSSPDDSCGDLYCSFPPRELDYDLMSSFTCIDNLSQQLILQRRQPTMTTRMSATCISNRMQGSHIWILMTRNNVGIIMATIGRRRWSRQNQLRRWRRISSAGRVLSKQSIPLGPFDKVCRLFKHVLVSLHAWRCSIGDDVMTVVPKGSFFSMRLFPTPPSL